MIPSPAVAPASFFAGVKPPEVTCFQEEFSHFHVPDFPDAKPEAYRLLLPEQEPYGGFPETAFSALNRYLAKAGWHTAEDGYSVEVRTDRTLKDETHVVTISEDSAVLTAGTCEGLRRALYFFMDKFQAAEGHLPLPSGVWKRSPAIRTRIVRCGFAPTSRGEGPDELSDDRDYYPESYLDLLARDGINGLWIPLYMRNVPNSVFPHFGEQSEKRFAKLNAIVSRCSEYGIRIFIYFSEPTYFSQGRMEEKERLLHPELAVKPDDCFSFETSYSFFCTSQPAGKEFIRQCAWNLFSAVPRLGGIINIMYGEDNGTCLRMLTDPGRHCSCPECAEIGAAAVCAEQAKIWSGTIQKINPDAEYIGWFYAPRLRDGDALAESLLKTVSQMPDSCSVMFNFESGARTVQQGKSRWIYDYSLALPGHSQLFERVAQSGVHTAAKLQVACSHEDASVPYLPVPGNLYRKYGELHRLHTETVMQCWFFGNYPGVMNRAAGMLAFAPLPETEEQFLSELAAVEWGTMAEQAAGAYQSFAEGYRAFPAELGFAWYGPLHHSLVWPLHLFPSDTPLAPSWRADAFPRISGDRIGEALLYCMTLPDALAQCRIMLQHWENGMKLLNSMKERCAAYPERLREIGLCEAILLQIRSACNVLEFYRIREAMFAEGTDRRAELLEIVSQEIRCTLRMKELCMTDPRLGFHPEAETYLFYPEKLQKRADQLKELAEKEFPLFTPDAPWIGEWTGRTPSGPVLHSGETIRLSSGIACTVEEDQQEIRFRFQPYPAGDAAVDVEGARLFPILRMMIDSKGRLAFSDIVFREPGGVRTVCTKDGVTLCIQQKCFSEFRHAGQPFRFNIHADGESWIAGQPLPGRLLFGNMNPECMGWFISGNPVSRRTE